MLENIRTLDLVCMPILQLLLSFPKSYPHQLLLDIETSDLVKETTMKYRLNEDQAKVLQIVANWFAGSGDDPQFCLVHGPFGSGKSHLLVILTIFLSQLLERKNDFTTKILVSAATNVAIDRILTGLLKCDFKNFLRVGSLKMIAKNIMPYSLQVVSKADDDELAVDMHTQHMKAEKDEKLKEQRQKLNMVRVVGVTCFSSTRSVFKGSKFKVCLLDECSQIPEPLSLLPLCQFGCEKLVAVGDPAQLPPLLSGGDGLTDGEVPHRCKAVSLDGSIHDSSNHVSDKMLHDFSANLTRPLFVRLVAMGHAPVLLRTQYRCHPRLAEISNKLFYEGQLKSGCSEVQRPSLTGDFPPLLFLETYDMGKEVRDEFNSYSNSYEAEVACQLVTHLLEKGVSGSQIGVIVLYRSQALIVQKLLLDTKRDWQSCDIKVQKLRSRDIKLCKGRASSTDDVQVSTVDGFQGMEKDAIILSCCRTNGLGFLSSPNRINVALTRARHHLFLIGKAENLQKSYLWRELISTVKSTPGAYESASLMIGKLKQAVDRNGRTASEGHEEFHDGNQEPSHNSVENISTSNVATLTENSLRGHTVSDPLLKHQQHELRRGKRSKKLLKTVNKGGIGSIHCNIRQTLDNNFVKAVDVLKEITNSSADNLFDRVITGTDTFCSDDHSSLNIQDTECYANSRQNGENEGSEKLFEQQNPEPGGDLAICCAEVEEILNDLDFRARDFWDGYKLYCMGHYSHSAEHKEKFLRTKMGHVICKLHGEPSCSWGADFDEKVREALAMMEDYVKNHYGEDCKDVRALIKRYDNLEELAETNHGNSFLQLVEDESSNIEMSHLLADKTSDGDKEIFNQIRQQLGKMDTRIQHLEDIRSTSNPNFPESTAEKNEKHLDSYSPDRIQNRTFFSEEGDDNVDSLCLSDNTMDEINNRHSPQVHAINCTIQCQPSETSQEVDLDIGETHPIVPNVTSDWLPTFDLGI